MWCNQQAVWQCNPLQLPQQKDTIESSICTISGATFPGENMVHYALIEHSSAPSSRYTEATTNEETWDGISHCFKYAGTICACHDTWSITWVTTYTSHLVVEHTNTSLSAMGIGNRYATIWLRTSLILWVTRSLIPNPITITSVLERNDAWGCLCLGSELAYKHYLHLQVMLYTPTEWGSLAEEYNSWQLQQR